jgi:hypothetical protein
VPLSPDTFELGPVAGKAGSVLIQRMTDRARSYERQEDPDRWRVKCAAAECERILRSS